MMSGDTITELLRALLAAAAAVAAGGVMMLFRRSRDPNPIPWAFFTCTLIAYTVALVALLVGSDVVVAGWWRPTFSLLNLSIIVGSLWVLRRAVRHAW
jgi:hypothetical protein